ncbi:serine/threonine protein kinase [Antribacter sp. KLBMP9083]|uniref:non-specific serine/threonine protein kinase n=1 Tax=Antribacter soli TaxID=2910976 RepID=A0AA41U7D1_9MICO|nr:serine/threonine-protein kinase [Antribacter soli]MCF4121426.1 serine/threonine protein kinase [Antribacter soli]
MSDETVRLPSGAAAPTEVHRAAPQLAPATAQATVHLPGYAGTAAAAPGAAAATVRLGAAPDPGQPSGRIPATGEVLGGFVLHESLGHGGFAHVYRAESAQDGEVALKVLTNAEPSALERFVAEADLLSRLDGRGFPGFVRADLESATPWFAMELVPGSTLQQLVQTGGPLARRDVLHVADDVVGALSVLQEEHFLHRDVKPANIIASGGRAVLIDLGIAKGHDGTTSTHAAGTIAYMAPELFARKAHARSDVYSLGLLLVFLSAGTLPPDLNFLGRDLEAEDLGPVDARLVPLILALTRHRPEDRPPLHNIARTVLALISQEEPDPGLLDAAEATRAERALVTEVLTAGTIAAATAAAPTPVQSGEPMTNLVYDQALMRRLHDLHADGFDGAAEQVVADHVAAVGLQRAGGRTPGEIKDYVWSAMRWTAAQPPAGYENSHRGWTAFQQAKSAAQRATSASALPAPDATQRLDPTPRPAYDPGQTVRLPPQPAMPQQPPAQRFAPGYAPQPGVQSGYAAQPAGYPGGPTPGAPGQHPGAAGFGPGAGTPAGQARQGGYPGAPGAPDTTPSRPAGDRRPERDDRTDRDDRDGPSDSDGWRIAGVMLGTWLPRVLLALAVYQALRLVGPLSDLPDVSTFPLFAALGDLAVYTFGWDAEWAPYVANLAIPALGLVLAVIANAVQSLRAKRGHHVWPYVLLITLWAVLIGIQAVIGFAQQVREDVEQGVEQSIEDAKQDVQDEIDQGVEDAKQDAAENVQRSIDEMFQNMFGGGDD